MVNKYALSVSYVLSALAGTKCGRVVYYTLTLMRGQILNICTATQDCISCSHALSHLLFMSIASGEVLSHFTEEEPAVRAVGNFA